MPHGTCTVCGCTEEHPCEGGCSWVGEEGTHCSQCVCWAVLDRPNPYEGILPYDLVPVRTIHPMRSNHPDVLVFSVDQRRIGQEARERLAFVFGPRNGITAEEFLHSLETGGRFAIAIPAAKVAMVQVSYDAATAAARIEEFRASGGKPTDGRRIDIFVPVPASAANPRGGARRG